METSEHCMFFVERKKRYCRMSVKRGHKYCGEHQQSARQSNHDDNLPVPERVMCPLDPTHTCFKSKLAKHIKICNAKKLIDLQPEYIIKGINLDDSHVPRHVPLSEIDQSIIDTVVKKVNYAYDLIPKFPEDILVHKLLQDKLNDESSGKAVRKHLLQNTSLLAHLERAGLVEDNTCYIEFGAGKGKLTYCLGQIIKNKRKSCILLVDKSSHRHKSDNKLKSEQVLHIVKRIRADIADLKLNGIKELHEFQRSVAIAKHLCGAATDLTLRCLTNAMYSEPKCNIIGLVIAFCCHHRCDYASYVGKKYLRECGFTENEFTVLCSIASWATCGCTHNAQMEDSGNSEKEQRFVDTETMKEREFIGRKVKTILNWGRVKYLTNAGFQSNLLYYTTTHVSLENMCIIAKRISM